MDHLLQEVGNAFAIWALETAGFKELKDVFPGTGVDNAAFGDQHDVIEKVKSFGVWLQKGNHDGVVQNVAELGEAFHDSVCGGTVQPCRDFVHQKSFWRPHYNLTCTN